MNNITPFHLAIPVRNLKKCRIFYRDILGCSEGRSSDKWVDFNFFGHQFVIHEVADLKVNRKSNPVDGKDVPVPHFGVILVWDSWKKLSESLEKQNIEFIIDPYIRFKGEPGEQATMFFTDPEGNALEFKSFKDMSQVFAQ